VLDAGEAAWHKWRLFYANFLDEQYGTKGQWTLVTARVLFRRWCNNKRAKDRRRHR
jgi:hypothetical protein